MADGMGCSPCVCLSPSSSPRNTFLYYEYEVKDWDEDYEQVLTRNAVWATRPNLSLALATEKATMCRTANQPKTFSCTGVMTFDPGLFLGVCSTTTQTLPTTPRTQTTIRTVCAGSFRDASSCCQDISQILRVALLSVLDPLDGGGEVEVFKQKGKAKFKVKTKVVFFHCENGQKSFEPFAQLQVKGKVRGGTGCLGSRPPSRCCNRAHAPYCGQGKSKFKFKAKRFEEPVVDEVGFCSNMVGCKFYHYSNCARLVATALGGERDWRNEKSLGEGTEGEEEVEENVLQAGLQES